MDYPFLIFVVSFVLMWAAAVIGLEFGRWRRGGDAEVSHDFDIVVTATLTLLGLIIGFSFSMATGRYDMRKGFEESEANAIMMEDKRLNILPPDDEARVKTMLRQYTDLRIQFYNAPIQDSLAPLERATEALEDKMWQAITKSAVTQSTSTPSLVAVTAMAVTGMNDVINAEGRTEGAWWNRLPTGAWILMFALSIYCNWLLGYGASRRQHGLMTILPLVIAIAFFLIADIDSSRAGVIHVTPVNLIAARARLGS